MLNTTLPPTMYKPMPPAQRYSVGYSSTPLRLVPQSQNAPAAPSVQFSGKIGTLLGAWWNSTINFFLFRSSTAILKKEIEDLGKVQDNVDKSLATARVEAKRANTELEAKKRQLDDLRTQAKNNLKARNTQEAQEDQALMQYLQDQYKKLEPAILKAAEGIKQAEQQAQIAGKIRDDQETFRKDVERQLLESKKALEDTVNKIEQKKQLQKLRNIAEAGKKFTEKGIQTSVAGQIMERENREYEVEMERLNMAMGSSESKTGDEAVMEARAQQLMSDVDTSNSDLLEELQREIAEEEAKRTGKTQATGASSQGSSSAPKSGGSEPAISGEMHDIIFGDGKDGSDDAAKS